MPELPGPYGVLARLLLALVLGGAVTWVYLRTARQLATPSLPTTLVLLSVLIAMVTQVIGDNVARAFSLVGALSIVRFRTVVRDTRDTAFVIFAVATGMAAGAQHLEVALIGFAVVSIGAFLMTALDTGAAAADRLTYLVRVRAALAIDLDRVLAESLGPGAKVMAVSTAKQGTAIEAVYEIRLTRPAHDLLREINKIDGIQEVRIERSDFEQN